MATEKDVLVTEQRPASLERLRRLREQAKAESPGGRSRRLRRAVWSGWVWCLLRAAEATWKQLLGAFALVLVLFIGFVVTPAEEEPRYGLDHEFAIASPEFLATIAGATDTPFVPGNRIEILSNGDQFYPAMLAAIEQARQSVTMEVYIYWAGEIGGRFAEALAAKARAGVPVRMLLDAVGSSYISAEIVQPLEASGCQVRRFRPLRWYTLDRFNNRTHRESLIIDGRIGFTGGAGIADHWLGHAQDPGHWRDTQIRLEGPAVTALQTGFARNWLETTGELISGEAYYPPPRPAGPLAAQAILSSPETGSSTVRIMYYLSIVCARKSIYIANPYFVPDERAIEILSAARRRGVDVKIMVAGLHNDIAVARYNSTRLYGKLLEVGVEIYEYNRTMMHQKYMVCDGVWTTVGTTNFDNRAFALNDESNVCVYDPAFAAQLTRLYFDDLAACDRVELDQWRNRGASTKLKEFLSSFLRKQV